MSGSSYIIRRQLMEFLIDLQWHYDVRSFSIALFARRPIHWCTHNHKWNVGVVITRLRRRYSDIWYRVPRLVDSGLNARKKNSVYVRYRPINLTIDSCAVWTICGSGLYLLSHNLSFDVFGRGNWKSAMPPFITKQLWLIILVTSFF